MTRKMSVSAIAVMGIKPYGVQSVHSALGSCKSIQRLKDVLHTSHTVSHDGR